ncbi:HD domain-containing phosphohydrolase [Natranaerobius trueperi]|uniref:HD domain-containing phosphohydrolase n=1 Tax=Natranaerobius trueperi TaxID=759412 RepID=UPI001303D65D|nr:HD domain-containing phosphohydrolase [Natranaerobius trueperi]
MEYSKFERLQQKYVKELFNILPDGVVLVDENNIVIDANPKFLEMFKYEKGELIGQPLDMMISNDINFDEADSLTSMVKNNQLVKRDSKRCTKFKELLDVFITAMPLTLDNQVVGGIGIYKDITAKERADFLANRDPLTGIYNRRYAEKEINRLEKEDKYPISFILGDINDLKLVNDTLGIEEGNRVLKRTVEIMDDVLAKKGIISRWSGDEFLIILEDIDEYYAQNIMKQLREAFKKGKYNDEYPLNLAFGYATVTGNNRSIRESLSEADTRMNRQKLLESHQFKGASMEFLKRIMPEKGAETLEHTDRMKEICRLFGQALDLSESVMDELLLLASLHDIGKISVSEKILIKKGSLTEEEWEEIKKHPEAGYRMVKSSQELSTISEGVLYHHERYDGKGYPSGIKGKEIPLLARVIAIVDAFEVMTRGRPYKGPVSKEEALDELMRCAGTQFDPELVKLFINEINQHN